MNNIVSKVIEDLDIKLKEVETAKEAATAVIRENFKDLFLDFFNKHPQVDIVGWQQYTPYFADGDPCVFAVYEFGYRTFADCENDDYLWGSSVESLPLSKRNESFGYTEEMVKDWKDLKTSLSNIPEDIYLRLFGDHAQITVNRYGVSVVNIDHD